MKAFLAARAVDPPYSDDAQQYQTPMLNRRRVIQECLTVLQPGGVLCWLDTVWPFYSSYDVYRLGAVGIWVSMNHRVRGLTLLQRVS